MGWKTKLLGVLILAGAAAYPALKKQNRWAQKVNAISGYDQLLMPIDMASMLSIQAAAMNPDIAGRPGAIQASPPQMTYATAILEDGRSVTVRLAYTEKEAPEGAMMTAPLMELLRSVADDTKAEGLAVNRDIANAPVSLVLAKSEVLRMMGSLKQRGFQEVAPRWERPAPAPIPAPEAAEPPPASPPAYVPTQPGKWVLKMDAPAPENKLKVIVAVRDLSGKGLAETKALVESLPGIVVQGVSPADARRWRDRLNEAGGACSIYEAP